jgi:two-component system CheB/CheR fusion protein
LRQYILQRRKLPSLSHILSYTSKSALFTSHYALIPQGFLLLGLSETIGTASDLFRHLGEYKQQLYVKKSTSARSPFVGPMNRSTRGVHPDPREEGHTMLQEEGVREFDLQKETDRLLASYAPASVVIDAEMDTPAPIWSRRQAVPASTSSRWPARA